MKKIRFMKKRPYLVDKIVFAGVFVFFTLYAASLIYPFVWGFFASLKTPNEYFRDTFAMPKEWLFSNYTKAFNQLQSNDVGFWSMTWNSIWQTFTGLFVSLSVLSLMSYTVAKYEFKMKTFILGLNMFLILIPIGSSMAATYRLYHSYGIVNNPLFFVVTSTGGFGMSFLIFMGFYRNISWSYAEAAFIDGAGHFRVYTQIMLPMAAPMLGCMVITGFIGRWNDYMTPILYMDAYPTLASGLFTYRQVSVERYGTYPVFFAGSLISMVPTLVLYTLFHKTIMENMLGGGVKE